MSDFETLMEKVAEVAPEKNDFINRHAHELMDSPFKEEFLEEVSGLAKLAMQMPGWAMGAAKGVGAGAMAVGGSAAAGIAYALAGDMYDATKRGILKGRHYKNMLDANPELANEPAKNVQMAFSVLHRFNPEFASDPIVAGNWVKNQVRYPDMANLGNQKELSELIGSRKNLTDVKKLPQVPQLPGKKDNKKELDDVRKMLYSTARHGVDQGRRFNEHVKRYDEDQLAQQAAMDAVHPGIRNVKP